MNQLEKSRRRVMKYCALGLVTGAVMNRADRVAAMQLNTSPTSAATISGKLKADYKKNSEKLLLPRGYGGLDQPPQPATFDMLPIAWNQRQMRLLFTEAARQNTKAVLLRVPANVQYFTGYSYHSTERPQVAFMNKDDEAPWYFHPVIDNELVRNGWFGGEKVYFDFPHTPGGFPNEGKVVTGPRVDLFEFMLEGVKDKGVQGGKIGVDGELRPSELAKLKKILPGVEAVNIEEVIKEIRIAKTTEELALWSRAYAYIDRGHAFARDYLMTYGTDITDLELQSVTELWLADLMYQELDLAGGLMNHGVGTVTTVKIRAGRPTAYPHPNQPYYSRILRNQPLQVSSVVMVGNCGGENYRMYQIADQAETSMRTVRECGRSPDTVVTSSETCRRKERCVVTSLTRFISIRSIRGCRITSIIDPLMERRARVTMGHILHLGIVPCSSKGRSFRRSPDFMTLIPESGTTGATASLPARAPDIG